MVYYTVIRLFGMQGQERTGTVLALWLHHRYLLTIEEAVHEVTAYGAGVCVCVCVCDLCAMGMRVS